MLKRELQRKIDYDSWRHGHDQLENIENKVGQQATGLQWLNEIVLEWNEAVQRLERQLPTGLLSFDRSTFFGVK